MVHSCQVSTACRAKLSHYAFFCERRWAGSARCNHQATLCVTAATSQQASPQPFSILNTPFAPTLNLRDLKRLPACNRTQIPHHRASLPAPRELAPPFDERFRGWNGDKVSQVSYTAYLKYKFMVLPAIWLVSTLPNGHGFQCQGRVRAQGPYATGRRIPMGTCKLVQVVGHGCARSSVQDV